MENKINEEAKTTEELSLVLLNDKIIAITDAVKESFNEMRDDFFEHNEVNAGTLKTLDEKQKGVIKNLSVLSENIENIQRNFDSIVSLIKDEVKEEVLKELKGLKGLKG